MYEVVMEMVDKMGYEVKSLIVPLNFLLNAKFLDEESQPNRRLGLFELPQEFTRRITHSYFFQRFANSGLQNASSVSISYA